MNAPEATASPALPASLPQLRPARFDDYAQIERLESSHGLLTLRPEDWRRMWSDHPLRQRLGDGWPIGWVLEDDAGRIVGSLANIPSLYRFHGCELVAATGRGWVVLPEYRGIALWLMDEYFNQPGVDLFINTTVNSMAVDPFSAFGSARVPLGDWESAAFWVTTYRGFAATALRIKHVPMPSILSFPAAAGLRLKDAFTARVVRGGAAGVDIAVESAFDHRFDAFWAELQRENPNKLLGVRDRQTLSWHFGGPLRVAQAWILTASRNGLLRAYCVVKRQDHPPSGLIRMRMVDFQTLEPSEDLLSPVIAVAHERCRAEGIHVFEHVGCGLPKMKAFDGAAPYRRKLPAWPFYYHASDPGLNETLKQPEVWDPSTFDGDASL